MAQPISELVTSKLETRQKLKQLVTSLEIRVRVLEIAHGLTCTDYPNDMTGWYCKCYKELGEQRFQIVASSARQGRTPKALFGWLLKQEMGKHI
jgi:hypothetical protein